MVQGLQYQSSHPHFLNYHQRCLNTSNQHQQVNQQTINLQLQKKKGIINKSVIEG
jgi:hypothetical protein